MGKLTRFNNVHYIHFVTTRTYQLIPYFKRERNCLILLKVINELKKRIGFKLLGHVIMPDHFHCLIEPDLKGKYTISYIMMCIKGWSARLVNLAEAEPSAKQEVENGSIVNLSRLGEGLASPSASPSSNIWQKSFWDFPIYSEKVFEQKLNYIHNNPVRSGLVKNVKDYPWSSYHELYK
jgi:putative transposase